MTKGNNYPFGSTQEGRGASSTDYRFGFNGKENDGEWGTSLVQDYGFRLYNLGIGRFLSVDPLAPEYPWYTPYQFAGNKPIQAIDLDGLEEWTEWLWDYLFPGGAGTGLDPVDDEEIRRRSIRKKGVEETLKAIEKTSEALQTVQSFMPMGNFSAMSPSILGIKETGNREWTMFGIFIAVDLLTN